LQINNHPLTAMKVPVKKSPTNRLKPLVGNYQQTSRQLARGMMYRVITGELKDKVSEAECWEMFPKFWQANY
jgi:hypothetical protein